ncbi:dephospho-CoA kinase [Hoyosella sp. YIM 151337]|uniref:dephospho-CoA kinase n=1 Tax=Hoyosella sp. YIM 151337 TaxID=2992742 RepID=UPI002236722F|nr:dephospho-CoA kinase [Hoyosella sp. YIM 151337]MCW4355621.1 dephospho-CoA kinase [Hoyosella sp. YIM 151337]
MLRVGLTGGIGAGKSTVSKVLDELGAVIIDADQIAREVVAPGTAGLRRLVAAFGSEILLGDGSLNRPALAAKAFKDDESRLKLNSIVHPLVGRRTAELSESAPENAILVHDIPLLIENGIGPTCNLVMVVHAETEQRVQRLTRLRGMPEEDARARIAAQATDEERRLAADIWLDNTRSEQQLAAQVRDAWTSRLVPFEENVRMRRAATAQPELCSPDASWAAVGARLVKRLQFLAGGLAQRVEHIGSTAVPELPARDVIDLQVSVESTVAADEIAPLLEAGGFPRRTDITSDNPRAGSGPEGWEKRLHASADPGQPAHVHVRVTGSLGERYAIVFRDWLRSDAAARAEYAGIKQRAAVSPDYSDAKEQWFDAVYSRMMGN